MPVVTAAGRELLAGHPVDPRRSVVFFDRFRCGKQVSSAEDLLKQAIIRLAQKKCEELKGNGLQISALVHVRGDGSRAYQDERRFDFSVDAFSPNRHTPIQDPIHGPLVWAVHNMTTGEGSSSRTLNQIKTIREILKEWDSELNQKPSS